MKKVNIQKLDHYLIDDPKFRCQTPSCSHGGEWRIEKNYYCSMHGFELIRLIAYQKEDNK